MSKTTIKQHDITDCGAACLASVAAHHKFQIPIARIRQYASTDKKGTNVLGMVEAAEKLGSEAIGVRGELSSLSKIPKPAIAHIVVKEVLHHYVVIYKVSKTHITVMDPGDGKMHKKNIWGAIKALKGQNKTIVISTHRLQSITKADSIVVLKNGKLVEKGLHQELLSLKREYHMLWKNQRALR